MNKCRLHQIFTNYIENFEIINDDNHNENYKWEIAYSFHNLMNTDAPDFAKRIKEAWTLSANLIDSNNRYCFSALVTCAEKDPEAVRELFKNLFADDGGNIDLRQNKILKFIDQANILTAKLHSDNGVFMNDQRSAMAYLFLYDPDNHYLYKASEARSFASCIEFYDDWGSGSNFKLHSYYRMCDKLVEEIKKSDALINTHRSRFYDKNNTKRTDMHPDNNYHILAFDIIYGAPEERYNFYKGIPYKKITAESRRLYDERRKTAKELYSNLKQAQADADLLEEAKRYFKTNIVPGLHVKHKTFGNGKITEVDGDYVYISFERSGKTNKLSIMNTFPSEILTTDIPNLHEHMLLYRSIALRERSILPILEKANKAFGEYSEFLTDVD